MDTESCTKPAAPGPEAGTWTVLATVLGILVGSASAFFLWSLDRVTEIRFAQPGFLYALPLAGVLMCFAYRRFGKTSGRGNNLILDHIHEPGGGVPRRMAPLVLGSTLLSHLCGGSVGREGTAVQMGGSLASALAHRLKLGPERLPTLLIAGMAAGFGAVFGTPLAGAVFALEVPTRGRIKFSAWLPAIVGSFVGDLTCRAWGVGHTAFPTITFPRTPALGNAVLLAKILLAALVFGAVAAGFTRLAHGTQKAYERWIPVWWLRPVVGGVLVLGISAILGTKDYLGLSVSSPEIGAITLTTAFYDGGCTSWSWLWKVLLTALTLGAGFKGGEVTPLFFIGATLGNALSIYLGAPVDILAALGFVSVFCAASHTPITGLLLGSELFGVQCAPLFLVTCLVASFCCGSAQLYSAQRLPKPSH
jgi:H+/Cl- antiporter ClcA